jgi:WD40 repeat protein
VKIRLRLPKSVPHRILSPDCRLLATTGWDGAGIHLWDLATGNERHRLRGHEGPATPLAFSRDGKTLASTDSTTLRLWDVATGRELRRLGGGPGRPAQALFSPDGRSLAFRLWNENTVRFWDLARDEELRPLGGHRSHVGSVGFTADGRRLVSAGADRTIRFWDPATGRELRTFAAEGSPGGVWNTALAPAGGSPAALNDGGPAIRILDAAQAREIRRLRPCECRSGSAAPCRPRSAALLTANR